MLIDMLIPNFNINVCYHNFMIMRNFIIKGKASWCAVKRLDL